MKFNITPEFINHWVAHLKSITTISSGLIVSIIAIIQLADMQPKFVILAAVSLGLFLFSIIGSVLAQMLLINKKTLSGEELNPSLQRILSQSLFVANIGFLLAVLALTIFGVINVL